MLKEVIKMERQQMLLKSVYLPKEDNPFVTERLAHRR